jgi:two-component system cell cycle response regulator
MTAPGELVPLAERQRLLQLFRVGAAGVVAAFALAMPAVLGPHARAAAAASAAYVLAALAVGALWRLSGRRGLRVFGALLIADGVALASLAYATGGLSSPLRPLVLVHLIAVALLASYRTSLKLALWHSLLLLVTYYAQEAELLPPDAAVSGVGTPLERIAAFITAFWLVALATATFSANNERELRRRRFDLEALTALAADLDTAAASAHVADVLCTHLGAAFDIRRAVVLGAPGHPLALLAASGAVGVSAAPAATSVVGRAERERQTLLVAARAAHDDGWLAEAFPGGAHFLVVPLSAEGRSIGVLVAEHPGASPRVERRLVTMVERFAAHGALALRNAWLLEQVQTLASTDALTGIANRRTFETTLAGELERGAETGAGPSLVLIDIDHFKRLNDNHGHQVGDDVLRDVGAVLAAVCRDGDLAARYGGEEFALVLPGAGPDEALRVAERVRAAIAGAPTSVAVTASLGVASAPLHGDDPEALLRAADEALYASKEAGRNRVTEAPRTPVRLVG